jgi:hypothetical protein
MGRHDDLLARFQPALRYDANEQFFADSAAQYTDAPGIELRRMPHGNKPGALLASAPPAGKQPTLSLAFLAPQAYGSGAKVDRTDVICVRGSDYRAQYVKLRTARPDLNNRIYGRAAEANRRLWLQYWMWYFYNDHQLALGFGTHEGDWECVQYRMGIDGDVPDVAVYAQHRKGEKRRWQDVEKVPGRPDTPVVYVARGSHSAYFQAGYHQSDAWYDMADGRRPAPKLALEIVEDATHPWMQWPGRWGDTTPQDRGADLDQSSPTGPGTKRHWRNPDSLLENAMPSVPRTTLRAPTVQITRDRRDALRIEYDFSSRAVRPQALVVTVNSRNEKGVPPITHTLDEVAHAPTGRITTGVPLNPARHYDVYASTVAGDPAQPSASQLTEIDAIGPERDEPFGHEVAQKVGKLFARIRGDR